MRKLLFLCVFLAGNVARADSVQELNLDYEKFTLDNGLRVIVHEDRKAPIVAVGVWYHVGSKNEPPGKTGFAHLFEHLMCRKQFLFLLLECGLVNPGLNLLGASVAHSDES